MDAEIFIPISLFAMIAAIVIAPRYFKSRDRQRLLDTLRVAYDRGQPVPPELFDALTAAEMKSESSPDRDLRAGIIMIGVALAFVVLGYGLDYSTGQEQTLIVAAVGAFPGFVGLGHLVFWFIQRARTSRTGV